MSGSSIGDNGAIILGESLKSNSTLTELDLSYSTIKATTVLSICNSLKFNSTITALHITPNEGQFSLLV
uniref:Uncharacterized protein n=1 Tax=Arcella intermedia TaxID=1963864 RepID=A0A6B2LQT8_9EUKA